MLLLVVITAVTAVFVLLGIAAFPTEGGRWLYQAVPTWLVIEAVLIGAWFWERRRRGVVRKNDAHTHTLHWGFGLYILAGSATAEITRVLFPPEYAVIYSACYWSLLGVGLIASFWYAVFSTKEPGRRYKSRHTIAALVFFTGLASGPLTAILLASPGPVPPVIVIAGIAWFAPILLWEYRLYPFHASHSRQA
jgi:hypothetical protein